MKHPLYRRGGVMAVAVMLIGLATTTEARAVDPALNFAATPGPLACSPGDLPETSIQGRVPWTDYASGRATQGYTCNAAAVSHLGSSADGTGASGGYRVHRYVDPQGHICAYYDTTLLFPANLQNHAHDPGVWVLDMTDPAHPAHTDTLRTPAMQSPHESLSLNTKRGLLGAVMGNPEAAPGDFELYDLSQDCRHPALKASLPMGILGHEGSFSPDGFTYYASSLYGHTFDAIDVTNELAPTILWTSITWNVHGLNLSDDGNTLYFADRGTGTTNTAYPGGTTTNGLTVLDVSQIQSRELNPQVPVLSHLSWPHVGTPQTALPVTINGHSYLVEIDEFGGPDNVGAARIIDIADPRNLAVVSNIRLAVNNLENQTNPDQLKDPGTGGTGLQGYRGHYCGVPREVEPGIVACTFILSGLRVFDIRDPLVPKEIAYFNQPSTTTNAVQGPQGAYAMSQPAFDIANHQVWYSDGNSGFYAVHIADSVWPTTLVP